jgi:hypothetical protein
MNTLSPTTAPPIQLRGDICPAWCGGEHWVDREGHPNGHRVEHRSPEVDRWRAEGAREEDIVVSIAGYRFDTDQLQRFPDVIQVRGEANPGFTGDVELPLPDARRLAKAIALACDLLEGRA